MSKPAVIIFVVVVVVALTEPPVTVVVLNGCCRGGCSGVGRGGRCRDGKGESDGGKEGSSLHCEKVDKELEIKIDDNKWTSR